jgi:hypothetical protein
VVESLSLGNCNSGQQDGIVAVDSDYIGSSGPSIAARHGRLTSALGS